MRLPYIEGMFHRCSRSFSSKIILISVLQSLLDTKGVQVSIMPVHSMQALAHVFSTMIENNKEVRDFLLLIGEYLIYNNMCIIFFFPHLLF